MDAYCRLRELTPDELFEEALRYWIHLYKTDPEGARKAAEEAGKLKKEDAKIQLIRYYPVYRGETEAMALKKTG